MVGGFAIIDIVIAGVALLLVIVGIVKGFSKQLLSLFGTLAVIVGAVLLSTVLAGWLQPMVGESIQTPITQWIVGLDTNVAEGDRLFTVAKDWTLPENVVSALTKLGLPTFVSGLLSGAVASVFAGFGTAKLVDVLPAVMTEWALVAISFIALIIVLSIALALIRKLFKNITKLPVIHGFDKLLGGVLGIAEAYLIFSIFFMLLAFIPASLLPELQAQITSQIEASVVAKFLSANNLIGAWILSLLG